MKMGEVQENVEKGVNTATPTVVLDISGAIKFQLVLHNKVLMLKQAKL